MSEEQDEFASATEQCWHPDCENRATAVYEGVVPPAGAIRRKACWEHGTKTTPVRFIQSEGGSDV